ncbi:hypothetical protein EW145_g2233 [Phellinidium pouzarii]|uniref:Phospholipid/glycerol acyltransferase domain-containing protein n=1 Tax=Phellinidium pouzarii TaxID=167371 RepID=A0A4S4LC47_9AGAM|nr:hypothetical protein EW145_g2233 [Phellinidium pouzarii]
MKTVSECYAAATTPHRRIITYWTKASLFKNPVSRFILRSAGTIPVARSRLPVDNETHKHVSSNGSKKESDAEKKQEMLFKATYNDLASGGALAIFPEGTSYTMPHIVQVKQGAARAALGFAKWALERGSSSIVSVVPVGIVYTDKSKYRSRLYVKYGKQILLESFVKQFLYNEEGSKGEHAVVQRLTTEIEKGMLHLTINARDWETLYAAQSARDILWTDEGNIPLEKFVDVSQALIGIFEEVSPSEALGMLKAVLLRYHALQYHTGVTHTSLSHIPLASPSTSNTLSSKPSLQLPDSTSRLTSLQRSSLSTSRLRVLAYLSLAIINLIISSPVHLAYAPGYILGTLAARLFASKEEEARAQFKVVFGGFGSAVGAIGIALILSVWHARVIDENHRRYERIRATFMVLRSSLLSPISLSEDDLKPYLTTPPPLMNPYIAKSLQEDISANSPLVGSNLSSPGDEQGPKTTQNKAANVSVSKSSLMQHLLHARAEATIMLQRVFRSRAELPSDGEVAPLDSRDRGDAISMAQSIVRQLVVFDFDWSLADQDTDRWIFEVLAPHLRRKMKTLKSTVQWTDLVAHSLREVHAEGITREDIENALRIMPFHPAMIRAVKRLKARTDIETTIFILSNSNSVFISTILEAKGITDLFDLVVTNPAEWDPSGLLKLRRRVSPDDPQHKCLVGCSPNMCKGDELDAFVKERAPYDRVIYIGDGSNDFCPVLRLRETHRGLQQRIDQEGGVKCNIKYWGGAWEVEEIFGQL